jgi:carbon-monoxide dehydrogenase catalytic subunit
VGIPPVLHLGSCVDNSRILLAATEVVKAGGIGNDISELPAAGSAPEWMSEKAINRTLLRSSTLSLVLGCPSPAHRFSEISFRNYTAACGTWRQTPSNMKMIAHIDKKRKALGIDRARERNWYGHAKGIGIRLIYVTGVSGFHHRDFRGKSVL